MSAWRSSTSGCSKPRTIWAPARGATFRQVTLPLSAPGIVTGCMLVFILLMGEYLIPAMLGGGKVFFIGNALVDLFLQSAQLAVRLRRRHGAWSSIMLVTVSALSARRPPRPAAGAMPR